MNNHEQNKQEELVYLEKTLNFIKEELHKEEKELEDKLGKVIESGKEMWEESVHFSEDFDRIPEMNQHLFEVKNKTRNYNSTVKKIYRYKKMIKSPYFGRFDFVEEGFDERENIYIGMYNLIDSKTDSIIVYDWRAPISSMFYRCELGKGAYKSPVGMINGDILLKRQYKIQESELKFFFDSSIRINDEILQEVLSRNSSPKMRNIVETIQKEQDIIIRDIENELLIVQGVAGSGKTSIALHRIAFLLYEGLNSKLSSNNVIIISPNSIFSKYISHVLPELGEENVNQITFDEIILKFLGSKYIAEKRNEQLEALISCENQQYISVKMEGIKFKGSMLFREILDRFIKYYEHYLIDFKDIYYNGEIIETKQQLKNQFLNNKIGMPMAKRLRRIENIILSKIHPLRKERLKTIEKIVQKSDDHVFEIKSFSRLLSIKESKVFMNNLHSFTKIDCIELYKLLFNKKGLILKLSKGLNLPNNIENIMLETKKCMDNGYISYEDCAPLLYIKLKVEGISEFSEIKQVVVDEAQDYYPLQYEVFKLLFKNAKYTILGDFNQTLEKQGSKLLYNEIEKILDKKKSVKLFMNKSYRSTFEINSFNKKLLNIKQYITSFQRHGIKPRIICRENKNILDKTIIEDIKQYYKQGYGSIAIICKTQKEALEIESRLKDFIDIKILDVESKNAEKITLVMPSYLAKGLEFDVVLVYDTSNTNYKSEFDRRLLYIACTRALHQLSIYYSGKITSFIQYHTLK